jgi:hypothetical protein
MLLQTILPHPILFAYLFANVAQSVGVEDCKNKKISQNLRI